MNHDILKLKNSFLLLAMALITTPILAQEEEEETTQTSNIQTFTPSKLLRKGQWDVKFFNGLYTQTRTADSNGEVSTIDRSTFFTNTNEIYTGVSQNSRINLGIIFQIRSNTIGGGALDVLNFEDNMTDARSGLTTIAASIRVQPFKNIGNFSFTSSLYFPVFKDVPDAPYLDKRSYFWETKFFYDYTFGGGNWQIFTEADFGFNFGESVKDADPETVNSKERFANNSLFVPLSAFLSYFPTAKSTIFVNTQQAFLIGYENPNKADQNFSQNYTQVGFGAKYQLTSVLNIETSFGTFVRGTDSGLGETFSLGLRALF